MSARIFENLVITTLKLVSIHPGINKLNCKRCIVFLSWSFNAQSDIIIGKRVLVENWSHEKVTLENKLIEIIQSPK